MNLPGDNTKRETTTDTNVADGLYRRRGATANLEKRFYFGIKGDMGNRDSVDGEFLAVVFGKMEKAADVIILVVGGKQPLGFFRRELEGRKSNGLAEFPGERQVTRDQFAQCHDERAASSFGRHRESSEMERIVALEIQERKLSSQDEICRRQRGLGKMLGGNRDEWRSRP